jgi:CBS domain-containing protein
MSRSFRTLTPDEPVVTAAELILLTAQTNFPVVSSEGRLVGLLTDAEVIRALRTGQESEPVQQMMHTSVPTATSTEPLYQAQERMVAAGLPALPVVDAVGHLTGFLTSTGVNEAYRMFSAKPRRAWRHGGGAPQPASTPTAQHLPVPEFTASQGS